MDDDPPLLDRTRPPSSLDTLLNRYARPEEDLPDTIPQPGDDYTAIARPGNKPEPMLCFILRDQSLEIFSYGNLTRVRQRFVGAGQLVTLRFVEAVITEVQVEGLGLHDLAPHLRQHRIPWIRASPPGATSSRPTGSSTGSTSVRLSDKRLTARRHRLPCGASLPRRRMSPMADLITFPTQKVAPDALPQPGDAYEAYGVSGEFLPFMLTIVFAEGPVEGFAYADLERMQFRPEGEDGEGEGTITLVFGESLGAVVVTGLHLSRLFFEIGNHRVHWLWEWPKGRAAVADNAPVVHRVELRAHGEASGA